MGVLQALVLGVVQGLTEFLPISSDGHLALTYRLFGQSPDLAFEVFLHAATLIAMIVFFRHDIMEIGRSLLPEGKGTANRRIAFYIIGATAISGVLALLGKKIVEAANTSLIAIGVGFIITAVALIAAENVRRHVEKRRTAELGWPRVVGIAVAQALAALPGVSRSGMTISSGMMSGLTREKAARFSFLIGIPLIAAASLVDAKDVISGSAPMPGFLPSAVGFVAAGIFGYLAIAGLLKFVRKHPLGVFAIYTFVLGLVTIAWGMFVK